MKKYGLFGGDFYYAQGGMNDFRGSFDTLDEAVSEGENMLTDWFHVYDMETLKRVAQSEYAPFGGD